MDGLPINEYYEEYLEEYDDGSVDAAEALCIRHVLDEHDARGIEQVGGGYGKGYTYLAEEFRKRLDETLHELFSPDIPFRQTTDADVCQRCDFLLLCGRQRPKTD